MAGGATNGDEFFLVFAYRLIVLVNREELHDVVDDERYSIFESSTPEQEPISTRSINGVKIQAWLGDETREDILHALREDLCKPPSQGSAGAKLQR